MDKYTPNIGLFLLSFEQEQATQQVTEIGSHERKGSGILVVVKGTGRVQRELFASGS